MGRPAVFWRPAAQIIALALVAVLTAGCTHSIAGSGEFSGAVPDAPDANIAINGLAGGKKTAVDQIAANAISDIQAFWTQELPRAKGQRYQPLTGGFYSLDPSRRDSRAPCLDSPSDVRGNAFYCPSGNSIAWDRAELFPDLRNRFGPFLIAIVLAHEWGHAIQQQTSSDHSATIVQEVQADCFSGAWAAAANKGQAEHFVADNQTIDTALAGLLIFRDPVGANANEQQAHGNAFDRITAFQEGYEQGAAHCFTFDGNRKFTEVPFSVTDTNQGNMDFDRVLSQGPNDLQSFWSTAFPQAYQKSWQPVTIKPTDKSKAIQCGNRNVTDKIVNYCPADRTIYVDPGNSLHDVYAKTGDFGPETLFGIAFGQAVQQLRDKPVTGETALRSSICLTGAFAANAFTGLSSGLRLSPGDLDEAIQALLFYAGQPIYFDSHNSGFNRVSAFRTGFSNGAPACD